MLLSKEAELRWTNRIKTYYINKGYIFTNINDLFKVKVEDLNNGSHALVKVKCDGKDCENPYLKLMTWRNYLKCVRDDGKYYCRKCAIRIFGLENTRITKLKKGKSFAQWGIDNLGSDFLDKYWDQEKNIVDPWQISYGYTLNKVWIKCQEKDYHGSYEISCSHFTNGKRCSYCVNKKVHRLDSLGVIYPESLKFWSNKNKKSPFDYSYGSGKLVYWKCPENKHKDYQRSINNATKCNFRCPECQYSKGEDKISDIFNNNGFINISQIDYDKLDYFSKINNLYYIPQKEFEGLVGIKGGNLSYDFYIPHYKYNLLIEYQGEFHDNNGGNGTKYMKSKFQKQQEHDKRKREYAQKHNINLLEIWYWDYDNIEQILDNYLSDLKEAS